MFTFLLIIRISCRSMKKAYTGSACQFRIGNRVFGTELCCLPCEGVAIGSIRIGQWKWRYRIEFKRGFAELYKTLIKEK